MTPTTNETALGRATAAFAEALESTGVDDAWMTMAVRGLAAHLAAELIVQEQQAAELIVQEQQAVHVFLDYQDAVRLLYAIAEGKV